MTDSNEIEPLKRVGSLEVNPKTYKSSRQKTIVPSKLKEGGPGFTLMKMKGKIKTYAVNPSMNLIFTAYKRQIKIYKYKRLIQSIDISECLLNSETPDKDEDVYSDLVQEVMNVSMESEFGETDSLTCQELTQKSNMRIKAQKDRKMGDDSNKIKFMIDMNKEMGNRIGSQTDLNYKKKLSVHDSEQKQNKVEKEEGAGQVVVTLKEVLESDERSRSTDHELYSQKSDSDGEEDISFDAKSQPKWRISCIECVNQYLVVGLMHLDKILLYEVDDKLNYVFKFKLDIKNSKGFFQMIDIDSFIGSSYITVTFSRYKPNGLTSNSLANKSSSLIVEYGVINLTVLNAIKYSGSN